MIIFQDVYVDEYENDHRKAAAYLIAWCLGGMEAADKKDHRGYDPGQEAIAIVSSKLS